MNKANTSDTETTFLNLHLSVSNGFVSSKIYDKRDDFDIHVGYSKFSLSRRPSYMECIFLNLCVITGLSVT